VTEILKVWQCIGCGRIDHPQPCVGICQDRKAELVSADDYRAAERRIAELEALLKRMAHTRPRAGEWERSWRALQKEAIALIAGSLPSGA
jgi:hypothetical protein